MRSTTVRSREGASGGRAKAAESRSAGDRAPEPAHAPHGAAGTHRSRHRPSASRVGGFVRCCGAAAGASRQGWSPPLLSPVASHTRSRSSHAPLIVPLHPSSSLGRPCTSRHTTIAPEGTQFASANSAAPSHAARVWIRSALILKCRGRSLDPRRRNPRARAAAGKARPGEDAGSVGRTAAPDAPLAWCPWPPLGRARAVAFRGRASVRFLPDRCVANTICTIA